MQSKRDKAIHASYSNSNSNSSIPPNSRKANKEPQWTKRMRTPIPERKRILRIVEKRIPKSNRHFVEAKNDKFYQRNKQFLLKNKIKPSTYLYLTRGDQHINIFDKPSIESVKNLQNRIEHNKPIDVPILDVDLDKKQIDNHNGRHRAIASMLEGIKKIPVNEAGVNCGNKKECSAVPVKELTKKEKSILLNTEKLKPQPSDRKFVK